MEGLKEGGMQRWGRQNGSNRERHTKRGKRSGGKVCEGVSSLEEMVAGGVMV